MNSSKNPKVLLIDDEPNVLKVIGDMIAPNGYEITRCDSAKKGLELLDSVNPDIILLDVLMPEMDGYEFCSQLAKIRKSNPIPVIFLTGLSTNQDKAKAFSVGASDFISKPVTQNILLETVRKHLETKSQWKILSDKPGTNPGILFPYKFSEFRDFLIKKSDFPEDKRALFSKAKIYEELYLSSISADFSRESLTQYLSEFCQLPYFNFIPPEDIRLGVLPLTFCHKNFVVPAKDSTGMDVFILWNPFNYELLSQLKSSTKNKNFSFALADKDAISFLLSSGKDAEESKLLKRGVSEKPLVDDTSSILEMAKNLVETAVSQRASDIHIEPKESNFTIRFRIDGDMKEIYAVPKDTGLRLISRFKVLGGLDIAERRKAQDGAMETKVHSKVYKLRLATTSTPSGESMIIRLLDPSAKPKKLKELGMTDAQMKLMMDFSSRNRGLVLIVGPTGSGKTTTIYSLLSQVDCTSRSLTTIEDPVEYKIPNANQQQVNEKAGINFETLLKSTMRQDPDILFLGEIRDPFSAKTSIDFASTGHLTISTLHTSNATTAVFRLERLGVGRDGMSDILLGVVAQRLLKTLCPNCKKIEPISQAEREMLSLFTKNIPDQTAHPVGCPQCHKTGYLGREGVYEIIQFDPAVSAMVRQNKPIAEIRNFLKNRGDYLIGDHAIDKVKEFKFSAKDVYEKILIEEISAQQEKSEPAPSESAQNAKPISSNTSAVNVPEDRSVLVIEDDEDSRTLISHLLSKKGYSVTTAQDGIEALLHIGTKRFSLILSDVDLPNLDGFKLIEMLNQKGMKTPVLFLTGKTSVEDEMKGFQLGAVDYVKKPIQKDILLMRVDQVFKHK